MIKENKKKRGRPRNSDDKLGEKYILNPTIWDSTGNKIKNCENIVHKPNGDFEKGSVGGGRPLGAKNKYTRMFEQIGLDNAIAVYKKVIELALSGDISACKIVLDRAYPVRKGRNIALQFDGPVKTIQDANKLSEHITTMIITGEISAEEAEDYGKWIDRRMKSIIDSDVMDKMNSTMEKVKSVGK